MSCTPWKLPAEAVIFFWFAMVNRCLLRKDRGSTTVNVGGNIPTYNIDLDSKSSMHKGTHLWLLAHAGCCVKGKKPMGRHSSMVASQCRMLCQG